MREIIGTEAQRNLVLADNEKSLTFVDFTGMTRIQVYDENEKIDFNITHVLKEGTTPIVSY